MPTPSLPPIQAVIVDDEPGSVLVLKDMLHEFCPQVNVIATADSVKTGRQMLLDYQPELLFLDIALPDGYGFDLLAEDAAQNFDVVFTTAYNEFAIRAFQISALHYLLKPLDVDALIEAVERHEKSKGKPTNPTQQFEILQDSFSESAKKISLPTFEGFFFAEIEQIIRLEAEGSYTDVHLMDGKSVTVSRGLNKFDDLLSPSHRFCRVHHKHLVNLNRVRNYVKGRGGYLIMDDNSKVDVSVRRKEDFLKRMGG